MSKRVGSTVVEVKGSHAIYVSQPEAVAALVEQAEKSVKTPPLLSNPGGIRDAVLTTIPKKKSA